MTHVLKAVRFDETEHKDLLNFLTTFVDHKGRKNESEAIRFLMSKGFEALQNQPPVQPQQTIDVDKLKNELFQQIMSSLQFRPTIEETIAYINPNGIAKFNFDLPKEEVKRLDNGEDESSKPPTPNNPLIANMLANRKR